MDNVPPGSKKTAFKITPITLEIPPMSNIDLTIVEALSSFGIGAASLISVVRSRDIWG